MPVVLESRGWRFANIFGFNASNSLTLTSIDDNTKRYRLQLYYICEKRNTWPLAKAELFSLTNY